MAEHIALYSVYIRFDGETGEGAYRGANYTNWVRPFDEDGMHNGYETNAIPISSLDELKAILGEGFVAMSATADAALAENAVLKEQIEQAKSDKTEAENAKARAETKSAQLKFDNDGLKAALATKDAAVQSLSASLEEKEGRIFDLENDNSGMRVLLDAINEGSQT